jgi:hypothetical protein
VSGGERSQSKEEMSRRREDMLRGLSRTMQDDEQEDGDGEATRSDVRNMRGSHLKL